MDELCSKAQSQGTRILIDAEEQVYQPTIDRWAVETMRKYNRDVDAVVLNTYQAYLKCTRGVMQRHLELAGKEGWALGVKLVRGAYINIEIRSLIHDTKADTDACYDGIAHDLLSRSFDGLHGSTFPRVRVLLAGHNVESIRKASQLRKELVGRSTDATEVEWGMLLGMVIDSSAISEKKCIAKIICAGRPRLRRASCAM